ncbi:hypothetical protein [Weissella minor]|uniref:hypothetical protein n=1 Tax=Weissella minor TaxID=1620 RepID=UPI00070A36B8|nr:hypothetical protein [Weissella minor]
MGKAKTDLPVEQLIWVDCQTAASLMSLSTSKFNETIRVDPLFRSMGVESKEVPSRFSLELLRKYGRGEYK